MGANIEPHNEKAAGMWGTGGRAYEEVSRFCAAGIEHGIVRLEPKPGQRILDAGTGTGWASRCVAERGVHVVGIDIAEGMLNVAREIATERRLDIEYHLADAEKLPFADAYFDGVISTFGVMFAGQPRTAAAELTRVCRRGGRLSIVAWLPDSNAVEMRKVLAPYMPSPPPTPAPSPFNWGTREWMTEAFGKDFDLRFENGTVFQREPSNEAAWEVYLRGFGPVKALATALDDQKRNELKSDFIKWLHGFKTELGITIPITYLVTAGVRK